VAQIITDLKELLEESLLKPLQQNLNAPHLMHQLGYSGVADLQALQNYFKFPMPPAKGKIHQFVQCYRQALA
jgi:hypothetical protein